MTTESILAHHVSGDQREWFSTVADVLIPGDGEMPSASAVDIGGELLDRALRARPDLLAAFDAVLGGIEQTTDVGELRSRIDSFASGHRVEFDDFGHLLAGAYFMNDAVRQAIGYPGQEAMVLRDDLDDYIESLGDVVERGELFRPTP
jgi:hypothetical protein